MFDQYYDSMLFKSATTFQLLQFCITFYPETALDEYFEKANISPADRINYRGIGFNFYDDDNDNIYIYNPEGESFLKYEELDEDIRSKTKLSFTFTAKGYKHDKTKEDTLLYMTISPKGTFKITGPNFEKYEKIKIKNNKKFIY